MKLGAIVLNLKFAPSDLTFNPRAPAPTAANSSTPLLAPVPNEFSPS